MYSVYGVRKELPEECVIVFINERMASHHQYAMSFLIYKDVLAL